MQVMFYGSVARMKKGTCAFCHRYAELTGEHLWSGWVNGLLGAQKYEMSFIDHLKDKHISWTAKSLNLKVPVVCKRCNNEWMSDIENEMAKPVLSKMVSRGSPFVLSAEDRRSLAVFSFKTFVIHDHSVEDRKPFFSPAARSRFRLSLAIPPCVQMWAGMIRSDEPRGVCMANYRQVRQGILNGIEFYFLTYAVASIVIQLGAYRWRRRVKGTSDNKFVQDANMDSVTPLFWPPDGNAIMWPPGRMLDVDDIEPLRNRWNSLHLIRGG